MSTEVRLDQSDWHMDGQRSTVSNRAFPLWRAVLLLVIPLLLIALLVIQPMVIQHSADHGLADMPAAHGALAAELGASCSPFSALRGCVVQAYAQPPA